MRFKISSTLAYQAAGASTLILNVHALRTASQKIIREKLLITPQLRYEEFALKSGENRFVRLETGSTSTINIDYTAEVDSKFTLIPIKELMAEQVGKMDRSVIPFLFPSRYCQSDKLGRLAANKFSGIKHPYSLVVAITDWISRNIEYLPGSTNWQTSAFDTVTERAGVCRDFAHLGIAFCRALTIPARYVTAYAHALQPPDFHACFEAYIGGRWLLFDATRLAPLNGLVRIAMGRDAADAAVATIFGPTQCTSLKVSCEPVEKNFVPLDRAQLKNQGISLE